MMKYFLLALVLLGLAFIVYALAGRRGGGAGRVAAEEMRDLRRPEAPIAAPVETSSDADAGTWPSIFEVNERRETAADHAVDADTDPGSASSTVSREDDMFGWGKDKNDEPEATEHPEEEYVPRRGAGLAEDDAELAAEANADTGEVRQPSWTTSAHDADHTVAEERTEGERTTFDDDHSTTAEEDRPAESGEGAFDADHADGGDDVIAEADETIAADDADAADASDDTVTDEAVGTAPQEDDRGGAPGEGHSDEDEAAAAERGSQEAFDAGQRAASGEGGDRDTDALQGAQDGSVGAEALRPAEASDAPDEGSADGEGSADAEGDAGAESEPDGAEGWTRRISAIEEIRDGGYGVGSAATFEDGAMPLGHSVKAWEDTKTFVDEAHANYGDAEPHLWFTDVEAAERAGFRRVD